MQATSHLIMGYVICSAFGWPIKLLTNLIKTGKYHVKHCISKVANPVILLNPEEPESLSPFDSTTKNGAYFLTYILYKLHDN